MLHNVIAITVLVAWLSPTIVLSGYSPCLKNHQYIAYITNPNKCSQYFICLRTTLRATLSCSSDMNFNDRLSVCVLKGAHNDICKSCHGRVSGRFPYPGNCARYYDCAKKAAAWFTHEDHLQECPYLQLFNEKDLECQDYPRVICGTRLEPKNPCDYMRNQCWGSSHCSPCTIRHGDCDDDDDGYRSWKGKEKTPYYVLCHRGRLEKELMCSAGKLFHPKKRICVHPHKIDD